MFSLYRICAELMRRRRRAGREGNMCLLCLRFKLHLLEQTDDVLQNSHYLHLQAPSPQPKKGRRKSGLKPKKREGKGDEFLLQNGKQVQQEN